MIFTQLPWLVASFVPICFDLWPPASHRHPPSGPWFACFECNILWFARASGVNPSQKWLHFWQSLLKLLVQWRFLVFFLWSLSENWLSDSPGGGWKIQFDSWNVLYRYLRGACSQWITGFPYRWDSSKKRFSKRRLAFQNSKFRLGKLISKFIACQLNLRHTIGFWNFESIPLRSVAI